MEWNVFQLIVRFLLLLISFLLISKQLNGEDSNRSLQNIGAQFSEVLKYADAKLWEKAGKEVETLDSSVAFDILQWLKLRAGVWKFSEYESFLLVNDNWPGIELLRLQGEKSIDSSVEPPRIIKYFSNKNPLTAKGSLKFAEVLLESGEIQKAQTVMRQSWLHHSYSKNEFSQAIKLFELFLKRYHRERLDNLLWFGKLAQAKEMHLFVSKDYKALSNARIALQLREAGVDSLIKKVPNYLKNDPGLMFDRFSYRKNKNLHKGAERILLNTSKSIKMLGKPYFWVKGRSIYGRKALVNGEPEKAYEIVSNHLVDFSDPESAKEGIHLEWLAGFIAFQYLEQYEIALEHFHRFNKFVVNPINKAKANYWIGRSYEILQKKDKMIAAFAVGAKFQTTFYGQLSAERGNFLGDLNIISRPQRYDWQASEFLTDSTIQSAILLYYAGRLVLSDRFLNHSSEELNQIERLELSQLAHDLGLKASGLSIGKTAGKSGLFCPEFLFPDIEIEIKIDHRLEPLVAAIIRQESGFFSNVKSSSGAIGAMQVMPSTASSMAKKLGVNFSEKKLLRDRNYNVEIGTHYLKRLLKKFDGSKVLSIAAYNAGPQRIQEWIKKFGDPRVYGVDPLVWIELIPFGETRNYVKRVMEADWVYQGKAIGKPAPLERGRRSFGHKF